MKSLIKLLLATSLFIGAGCKPTCAQFGLRDDSGPFLLPNQTAATNGFVKYTAFTGYKKGVTPNFGSVLDSIAGTRRIWMTNYSKMELCINAWGEFFTPLNRIVLEVSDPVGFRYDSSVGDSVNWMKHNLHCLEIVMDEQAFKADGLSFIRQCLKDYLHVSCAVDRRKMHCLVLMETGGKNITVPTEGVSVSKLVTQLSAASADMPVINEVQRDMSVSSVSGSVIGDIGLLNKVLQPYGLEVRKEIRKIDVFIIKEM